MTSIIKVDQIQTAAGGVPSAASFGFATGSVLQVQEMYSGTSVTTSAPSDTWTQFYSHTFTLHHSSSSLYIPMALTIRRVSGNYVRFATRIVVNGVDVASDRRSGNYDHMLRIYDYTTPATTEIWVYPATYWVPSNYLNAAGTPNTIQFDMRDGTGSSTSQSMLYVNGSIQEIAG